MKLRTYRAEHQMTLAQVAARVGVSEIAISRYERGERIPRPAIMRRIAAATGGQVTANDFMEPPESSAA